MADIDYEAVIGLECHVQLKTRSKIFSGAAFRFGAAPNTQTDPYTLGLPGTLPVLNREAVALALRMGLAVGSHIARSSRFARKHYFYPDLPKGYQISQLDEPLCEGGHIEFLIPGSAERRRVGLIRIHMEEDAGKNTHPPGEHRSLIDLNRAGVPLIEVVTQPELRGAEEAAECLRAIRQLVLFLGISDGNMEAGSLRCDANVSLRPRGSEALGTKTELKNINSFRNVGRAIEHEIARQRDLLRGGGKVVQETRGWDADRGTSRSQRSKEEAHDYRYLPDPDLPPLIVDEAWLAEVRAALPETPLQRYARYHEGLGLPEADATLLTAEPEIGAYFDQVLFALGQTDGAATPALRALAKTAVNWVGSELLGALNKDGQDPGSGIGAAKVTPAQLAELLGLITDGTISGKIAKEVFGQIYAGTWPQGTSVRQGVEAAGLLQVSDRGEIEAVCARVVSAPQNQKQLDKYRAGADKLLGFFVGQVMRETGGRANPELVNEILRRLLAPRAE